MACRRSAHAGAIRPRSHHRSGGSSRSREWGAERIAPKSAPRDAHAPAHAQRKNSTPGAPILTAPGDPTPGRPTQTPGPPAPRRLPRTRRCIGGGLPGTRSANSVSVRRSGSTRWSHCHPRPLKGRRDHKPRRPDPEARRGRPSAGCVWGCPLHGAPFGGAPALRLAGHGPLCDRGPPWARRRPGRLGLNGRHGGRGVAGSLWCRSPA